LTAALTPTRWRRRFQLCALESAGRGGPLLSDLQPYRIVMWRTTDDIINYGTDEFGLPTRPRPTTP